MFASVTGTTDDNLKPLDYYSACGIQQVAFEKVT